MALDSNNERIPNPLWLRQIQYLCEAEKAFMPNPSYLDNAMAKTLRPVALKAIEAYYKCDDFDAFIPYLAMNYFDRFISMHKIQRFHDNETKNRDLFVICCLVLAWKITTKSFILPQFLAKLQIGYETADVMNMEALIIGKLEFLMRPLTPFSFAEYFIWFLNLTGDQLSYIHKLVHQIIVTSQADMRITTLRPSLVGASVVYAVSKKHLPEQYSSKLIEALSEFEHFRKMLLPICIANVESLKSSSAKKETKAETSSLGVGGTGQVAGASSSSLKKPVLPGASIDQKSKPDETGGAQLGSAARKETEGGTYGSGVRGVGQVARGSSPSLQELLLPAKQSQEERKPEGAADDKAVDKNPLEEEQQGPTGAKDLGKRPMEEIQQDLTASEEEGKTPMEGIQQDLTASEKAKDNWQMEEKLQVQIPELALAPASASTDTSKLDFELGWSKYEELSSEMSITVCTATSGTTCRTSTPSY